MNSLLDQIKERRKQLGMKQKDMFMRIGMSPQQYQRLEAKGNPRLDTLELVAKGLNSELMLIPQEKSIAVNALLRDQDNGDVYGSTDNGGKPSIADDPWQGFFKDDE